MSCFDTEEWGGVTCAGAEAWFVMRCNEVEICYEVCCSREVKWPVLKPRVDMASDEMKPRCVMMCCALKPSDGLLFIE